MHNSHKDSSQPFNPVKISKFLSLVLRHKPETVGIELDAQGWVDIPILLEAMSQHDRGITRAELDFVVANNDKARFAIHGDRIRASQGHSINVDLNLQPQQPPERLFHGTAQRNAKLICQEGLKKMNRQYVHLSKDVKTATRVGARHGKPLIFQINTRAMSRDHYQFFLSANGVWLVNHVPPQYLSILDK